MRITQFGSFKEVQRLVQLPAQPVSEAREFRALLAAISPDHKPNQLVSGEAEPPAVVAAPLQDDPRGRMNLPPPELRTPGVGFISPAPAPAPSAKEESQGVNVPTVVSAKRVSIPDPFMGMSKEQREGAVEQLVRRAGTRHGIDPALSMAVVSAESSFDPRALSADGHFSKGLMQLLDSTGQQELSQVGGAKEYEPYHPHLNVDLGVRYLRRLHDMFSSSTTISSSLSTEPAANSASLEKLAVAAFNAGQGRVASAQQRAQRDGRNPGEFEAVEPYLPQSTQEYVRRVMARRTEFEDRFGGTGEG